MLWLLNYFKPYGNTNCSKPKKFKWNKIEGLHWQTQQFLMWVMCGRFWMLVVTIVCCAVLVGDASCMRVASRKSADNHGTTLFIKFPWELVLWLPPLWMNLGLFLLLLHPSPFLLASLIPWPPVCRGLPSDCTWQHNVALCFATDKSLLNAIALAPIFSRNRRPQSLEHYLLLCHWFYFLAVVQRKCWLRIIIM